MIQGEDFLHRQLIRLGDMMGDGQHLEPGGKWIEREYAKVMRALGIMPKMPRNTATIDAAMAQRVMDVPCECGAVLKQARKGSMVGVCTGCGKKYRLLKKTRTRRSRK